MLKSLAAVGFACRSAASLFYNIPDRVGVIYRPHYEANARTPEANPLNVEDEILSSIMTMIRQ